MKNYSKQREEIIQIMQELKNHPTAEEIYFLAKQRDPAISRSTVYRNLKTLVEKRVVNQLAISSGPDRYEYGINHEKHGHAICVKCGNLFEFSYENWVEDVKESVEKQTGLEIWKENIVVRGICSLCRESSERKGV